MCNVTSIRVYFTLGQNGASGARATFRIHNNDNRFHRKQEFGIVRKVGLRLNFFCSPSWERNVLELYGIKGFVSS